MQLKHIKQNYYDKSYLISKWIMGQLTRLPKLGPIILYHLQATFLSLSFPRPKKVELRTEQSSTLPLRQEPPRRPSILIGVEASQAVYLRQEPPRRPFILAGVEASQAARIASHLQFCLVPIRLQFFVQRQFDYSSSR